MLRPPVSKHSNLIPVDSLDTPNNGHIDVLLTPQDRTKAKRIEEISINRVRYQVPENIIILDFWAKLAKTHPTSAQTRRDLTQPSSPSTPVSSQVINLDPILTRGALSPTAPTHSNLASASTLSKESNPLFRSKSTSSVRADLLPSQSSSQSSPLHPPPSLPSTPAPPPLTTSTTTPDISDLLQAAVLVNEPSKSHASVGLTLLGNAASLQSPIAVDPSTSNTVQPPLESLAPTLRSRTRGSARLAKSSSLNSQPPDSKTASNSTGEDRSDPNLSQPSITEPIILPSQPQSSSSSPNLLQPPKPVTLLGKTRKRNRIHSSAYEISPLVPLDPSSRKADAASLQTTPSAPPRVSSPAQGSIVTDGVHPLVTTTQRPRLSSESLGPSRPSVLPQRSAGTHHDTSTRPTNSSTSIPGGTHADWFGVFFQGGYHTSPCHQPLVPTIPAAPEAPVNLIGPSAASVNRKPPKSQTKRPRAPKALPETSDYNGDPAPSYSTRTHSHQATTPSLFENGSTPASQLKLPSGESSQPSGSNFRVQIESPLAQPSQLSFPQVSASTTSASHISPALKNQSTTYNETASISRPKKKARRHHSALSSQIIFPNLHGEISAASSVPLNASHLASGNPHASGPKDKSTGRLKSKHKLANGKTIGPGRPVAQHGPKSSKTSMNNPSNSSSIAASGALYSSLSIKPNEVPTLESLPATLTLSTQVISPLSVYDKKASHDKPPPTGQILDRFPEKSISSSKKLVIDDTPLPSNHQQIQPSQDVRNLASSSVPKKVKRKKRVKDSTTTSGVTSQDPHRTVETVVQSIAAEKLPSTIPAPEKVSAFSFSVDPRLTSRAATPVAFSSRPSPKQNASSIESPANFGPKVALSSIGLSSSTQPKQPGSTSSPKPPPKKRAKPKIASGPGASHPTAMRTSSAAPGSASAGPSTPPVTTQLSHPTLQPTATSFVPHPQNPLTLVPHPQRPLPFVSHPQHVLSFVPHPQHNPMSGLVIADHQLPLVGGQTSALLKANSLPPELVSGRTSMAHIKSNPQLAPCRDSLTVHGSSPPGLKTTVTKPSTTVPANKSKFSASLSRPSSTVSDSPVDHNNVFMPLPLSQPARATPEPSWN